MANRNRNENRGASKDRNRADTGGDRGESAGPAQAQRYLSGATYPATKQELVNQARQNDAPQDVVDNLQGLRQEVFNSAREVSAAIGQ